MITPIHHMSSPLASVINDGSERQESTLRLPVDIHHDWDRSMSPGKVRILVKDGKAVEPEGELLLQRAKAACNE